MGKYDPDHQPPKGWTPDDFDSIARAIHVASRPGEAHQPGDQWCRVAAHRLINELGWAGWDLRRKVAA